MAPVKGTAKSAARDKSVQNRLTCYRNVTHANKPAFLSSKLIQGRVEEKYLSTPVLKIIIIKFNTTIICSIRKHF